MRTTFGGRLKVALYANGIDPTPTNLARLANVSFVTARRWLRMKEPDLSPLHLARLTDKLGFRMYWLTTGQGIPQTMGAVEINDDFILDTARKLDEAQLDVWIKVGRYMGAARP